MRKVKRKHLDGIRGFTWVCNLAIQSGKSLPQLEVIYRKKTGLPGTPGKTQEYTNYFYKIKHGEYLPTFKRERAGNKTIPELFEEDYPGSSLWLEHPLFDLFERRHTFDELLNSKLIPSNVLKVIKYSIKKLNPLPHRHTAVQDSIVRILDNASKLTSYMDRLYCAICLSHIFHNAALYSMEAELWRWINANIKKAFAENLVLKQLRIDQIKPTFLSPPFHKSTRYLLQTTLSSIPYKNY